jgi:hypothetical protein
LSASPETIPVSHKRTSSAAGNTAGEPQLKPQASDNGNSALVPKSEVSEFDPQYVYVVMIDSNPQYTEPTSDIHAIYATIQDANNAVKGIVNNSYTEAGETDKWGEDDGRIHWSSDDAGEGERVEVFIRVMEVKPPGCEPEREWENGGVNELGSGEDYGEERDSEEDD